MRGTVFKRRVGKARLTYGVTVPAGICIGCITLAASHLPGPLLTASFVAATSPHTGQDLVSAAPPYPCLHAAGWGENDASWRHILRGKTEQKSTCQCVQQRGLQFLVKQPMKTSLGRWYNNKDLKEVREWVSLGKGLCGKGKQNSEALRPQHGWKFPKELRKPAFLEDSEPERQRGRSWGGRWCCRDTKSFLGLSKDDGLYSDGIGTQWKVLREEPACHSRCWDSTGDCGGECGSIDFFFFLETIGIIHLRDQSSFAKVGSSRWGKMRWDSGYI